MNDVQTILPHVEHSHCVRHIFANWHKSFKGNENKLLFWKAIKAYNTENYNEALDEIENLNHATNVGFRGTNPKVFYGAFFKTNTKTDVIVNNPAKTFNGYIINAMTKHLIYMLEDMITTLMQRLVMKRQEMEKTTYMLCSRIQEKLDKEKEVVANYFPLPSSNLIFQVNENMDCLIVDMGGKTCTYRKWDMCGIHCCHVVSSIFFSLVSMLKTLWMIFIKGRHTLELILVPFPPCVGERH